MKQLDYLKLVSTARKSSYYAKSTQSDEALSGLIGYGAVFALLATFCTAVVVSYFGVEIEVSDVGAPMGFTFILAALLLVCAIFVADGPKLIRVLIALIGTATLVSVLYTWYRMDEGPSYLFLPLFLYASIVSAAAVRQLAVGRPES